MIGLYSYSPIGYDNEGPYRAETNRIDGCTGVLYYSGVDIHDFKHLANNTIDANEWYGTLVPLE